MLWLLLMAHVIACVTATEKFTLCQRDILIFLHGLNNSEEWALQMYDSTTKLPDGLLYGNVNQLGNFDECLAVHTAELQGKYCRTSMYVSLGGIPIPHSLPIMKKLPLMLQRPVVERPLRLPKDRHLVLMKWALCVPSSCSVQEVQDLVDTLIPRLVGNTVQVSLASDIEEKDCYIDTSISTLHLRDITIMLFFAILVLFVAAATVLELKQGSRWRLVDVFSLRSTFSQLFSTCPQPGEISCLNGLRVGSTLWLLFGHRYNLQFKSALTNQVDATKFLRGVGAQIVVNGSLTVDTFLFLSGLLMSFIFLRHMSRGASFNILKFYLQRYLRLTPSMMAVILFYISVLPHLGSGPLWKNVVTQMSENCIKQWWISALYVQNIFKTRTMCLPQSWYVAVDMQLTWLSPLILLPLYRKPRAGVTLVLILTIISCVVPFLLTYVNNFPWSIEIVNQMPVDGDPFFKHILKAPYSRATPYLVGILLGYLLHHDCKRFSNLSKRIICAGWFFTFATCLTVIYTLSIPHQPTYEYNPLEAAFYASFHRLGWSLGLAWIVFACEMNYGGPVNAILSWSQWAPLGRLCYGAYLTQFILFKIDYASARNPIFYSKFNVIHSCLGDIPMVFALSFVLYVLVEGPVNSGFRLLMKTGSKKKDTESMDSKVRKNTEELITTKEEEPTEELVSKEKEHVEELGSKEKEEVAALRSKEKEHTEELGSKEKSQTEVTSSKEKEEVEKLGSKKEEQNEEIGSKEKESTEELSSKEKDEFEELGFKEEEYIELLGSIEKEHTEELGSKEKEEVKALSSKEKEEFEELGFKVKELIAEALGSQQIDHTAELVSEEQEVIAEAIGSQEIDHTDQELVPEEKEVTAEEQKIMSCIRELSDK